MRKGGEGGKVGDEAGDGDVKREGFEVVGEEG